MVFRFVYTRSKREVASHQGKSKLASNVTIDIYLFISHSITLNVKGKKRRTPHSRLCLFSLSVYNSHFHMKAVCIEPKVLCTGKEVDDGGESANVDKCVLVLVTCNISKQRRHLPLWKSPSVSEP